MKGFTKRFLAVMIAVFLLSQSGIAVFAADNGLSGKESGTFFAGAASDFSAVTAGETKLQKKRTAPEDTEEGSAQAFSVQPVITVGGGDPDDESNFAEITENDSHNWRILNYGFLSIYPADDEDVIEVSGNIVVEEGGSVDVWSSVNVTGTITVRAGGTLGIGGTVNNLEIEEGATVILGEEGSVVNMPEGYDWQIDTETGDTILKPSENQNENGAARIEDVHYPTLEEALNAAEEGQTVVLLDDITVARNITVEAGITLDLNGHDLSVGQTLSVTGTLVDSGENRGHFAASTYFISRNTGSEFPVYDSESGTYSLYELAVTTYDDTQTGEDGKYGFRLKKGDDRGAATALIKDDENAGLVEARVLICWKDSEDINVEKMIAYNSAYLVEHAEDPSHIILTFRMTGLDTVNGSVTATPMFVTKDANGNVIAELKGETLTVKE